MKERPILFSAPMIRALLSGTKTQTRRLYKLPKWAEWDQMDGGEKAGAIIPKDPKNRGWYSVDEVACPYGQLGDRLWVREAFFDATKLNERRVIYRADDDRFRFGFHPSIHMPRWASRLTLEITGVRVDRLADISNDDAAAEGVGLRRVSENDHRWIDYTDKGCSRTFGDPRLSFWSLWESINGKDSRDANPWVWVIDFKRIA